MKNRINQIDKGFKFIISSVVLIARMLLEKYK
jgi:hypothetical protein